MYLNPIFTKKIAYGSKGYPWTNHNTSTKHYYKKGLCPISEDLLYKKFIFFYQIAHSSTLLDMKDIINAIFKILANKKHINNFFLKKNKKFINQGRILN